MTNRRPPSRGQLARDEFRAWWLVLRDVVAFVGGLGILIFETIFEQADRPWLIAAALGMMGFPFAAAVDKWLKGTSANGSENRNGGRTRSKEEES